MNADTRRLLLTLTGADPEFQNQARSLGYTCGRTSIRGRMIDATPAGSGLEDESMATEADKGGKDGAAGGERRVPASSCKAVA